MDVVWVLTALIGILGLYFIYSKTFPKKNNYLKDHGVFATNISFFQMVQNICSKNTLVDNVIEMYKICNGKEYFGYKLMNTPILFVRDPKIINLILVRDFSYFQDRNIPVNDTTGLVHSGLGQMTGDKWRAVRQKLISIFTTGKLKIIFNQIEACGDDMLYYIKAKDGKDIDSQDFLMRCLLNVIGSIAYGINADALHDENEKDNHFVKMCNRYSKPSILHSIKVILLLVAPRITKMLRLNVIDEEVNKFFPKFIQSLIDSRKQINEKRNDFLQYLIDLKEKELAQINTATRSDVKIDTNDSSGTITNVMDNTQHMAQTSNLNKGAEEPLFSDEIIAAQAFLFITAGGETTSTVLSFLLHYLAVHREVQKKLQTEIDGVLSTFGFSYEAMKKMKYLEQVLYEVLRLQTPGYVILRVCTQNYKIPRADFIIEKGTIIQVPAIALHMDAEYFPEPEKFNPDRFEDMDFIPKGVFFPFGDGPRMCTAVRLAMLMMKVVTVKLLKTYSVIQSEKTPLPLVMCNRSLNQRVVGGLWIKFEERKTP